VWHLSYAALGAALAPHLTGRPLLLTVLAFFLAVGIAAHALDELAGHPLGTAFSDRALVTAASLALLAAVAIGAYGTFWYDGVNWALVVAVPVGGALVVAYNLELVGGRLHNDLTFALGWGGFPVVVGYVAQSPGVGVSGVALVSATGAAVAFTYAQRRLSTPARELRRRTVEVDGTVHRVGGAVVPLDRGTLLSPLEAGLRAMSWGVPLVACAVLLTHA
jgi:hypothetical protein